MKKRAILILTVLIGITIASQPAWAGSKQRHRWEGVAIGLGAAVLGSAILNGGAYHGHSPYVSRAYAYPVEPRPRYRPIRRHHRPRGHWETRQVWVPPTYERVWNPGHYTRRGRWVEGRWITLEKCPGTYQSERYWVSHR